MLAPTGSRAANGGMGMSSSSFATPTSRADDVSRIAALASALRSGGSEGANGATLQKAFSSRSSGGDDTDYDGQNMQTRKEAFLAAARSQKTGDYLRSTRSAPLRIVDQGGVGDSGRSGTKREFRSSRRAKGTRHVECLRHSLGALSADPAGFTINWPI